jgi:hypothetical protein
MVKYFVQTFFFRNKKVIRGLFYSSGSDFLLLRYLPLLLIFQYIYLKWDLKFVLFSVLFLLKLIIVINNINSICKQPLSLLICFIVFQAFFTIRSEIVVQLFL